MKIFFKRDAGFTLVELMVVVAIIGLLSAVVVPNFKKYQAKAKIAEAKLHLSAMYTAEASYFSDYNIYHNCFAYMGYDPGPEIKNRYYTTGITMMASIDLSAYASAVNSGLNSVSCPNDNYEVASSSGGVSLPTASVFPAGKGIGSAISDFNYIIDLIPTEVGDQSTSDQMFYIAGASGVISQDFTDGIAPGNLASSLSINEKKIIINIFNGY